MSFKTLLCATIAASMLIVQPLWANLSFKNERGSLLELKVFDGNRLGGSFTTAVTSKSCPKAVNKRRPIVGYIIGNALTFSVVYPMCDSVLSITGNISKDKNVIDTISILNKQSDDVTHEGPGARFIGHDTFKKVAVG